MQCLFFFFLRPPGGASAISEPNHTMDSTVHYNIPELQSGAGRSAHPRTHPHIHPHTHPSLQPNGLHCPPAARRDGPPRPELSTEEDSDEGDEEEEEEEEAPGHRWNGIESIFEAYQEYVEGELGA